MRSYSVVLAELVPEFEMKMKTLVLASLSYFSGLWVKNWLAGQLLYIMAP